MIEELSNVQEESVLGQTQTLAEAGNVHSFRMRSLEDLNTPKTSAFKQKEADGEVSMGDIHQKKTGQAPESNQLDF